MVGNTLDIKNSALSDLTNAVKDFSVNPLNLDSPTGAKETQWINSKFTKYFGLFMKNADLKSAIISKAIWVVGKGWTSDANTKVILDHITGNGKDTFDDILFNMDIVRRVNGDSYAEVIRDAKTGIIINLKTLNPATIKVIYDEKGIIKRYEQTTNSEPVKFEPKDIFHLSNNRIGDQIHGTSDIESLEPTLLSDMQSEEDTDKIMHRQAKPLIMFKLGTSDPTTIAAFIAKMDAATQKGENIYIPDDANSVSYDVVQVNISPLTMAWRDDRRKKFYRTIGLPELLPSGGGDSTESGGKIGYLCFEQIVEREQRYFEQQIWNQLNLKINLIPPASLSTELQNDNSKDGSNAQMTMQSSDTTAGVGR